MREAGASILWRHAISGSNGLWLMNGARLEVAAVLQPSYAAAVPDLSWEIRAAGDMNDDGSPDLIWQNSATGHVAVWFLSGATCTGIRYLYTDRGQSFEPDLDWKIVAAGDMDLDGQEDLLWRHGVSGDVRLWHMKGIVQEDSVSLGRVSDRLWELEAVADMNRDGLLDLVWRHYGDGAIGAWFMDDALRRSTRRMIPSESLDLDWQIVGAVDMNYDASPDLVWQHATTGHLGVWYMNGISLISARHLNPVSDPVWRVAGVREARERRPGQCWGR